MNNPYPSRCHLYTDVEHPTGSLLIAVRCRVGDDLSEDIALVDTASTWCIMPASVAINLGYELPTDGTTRLHTRFGLLVGELIRLNVTFLAVEGEPTTVEATWFLSADWPGPLVIGWKGCLQRMRFAFEPAVEEFHCERL